MYSAKVVILFPYYTTYKAVQTIETQDVSAASSTTVTYHAEESVTLGLNTSLGGASTVIVENHCH